MEGSTGESENSYTVIKARKRRKRVKIYKNIYNPKPNKLFRKT